MDLIKYTKLPVNYGHALVYMNETFNAHFTRYDNTADIVPVVRALIPDLATTWSTDGHVEPYTPIQFKASYKFPRRLEEQFKVFSYILAVN